MRELTTMRPAGWMMLLLVLQLEDVCPSLAREEPALAHVQSSPFTLIITNQGSRLSLVGAAGWNILTRCNELNIPDCSSSLAKIHASMDQPAAKKRRYAKVGAIKADEYQCAS